MLSTTDRQTLLTLARDSIRHGLEHGRPLSISATDYSDDLQQPRACFVTLHKQGGLRGCIGHLEAITSLVEGVAQNAYSAAFRDPRFPPVQADEFDDLHIHIEILTPPEPIRFTSQGDLLMKMAPGKDGLILSDGPFRGTFLPTVWEQLPLPEDFLAHLKSKAGLPMDYWSDTLKVERYRTESFEE